MADQKTDNGNEFQTVRNRRNPSKKPQVGRATDTNLRAVVSCPHLYLSKLDKNRTFEDVQNYLMGKGFPEFECQKMVSKRPDIYSSFKVGVPVSRIDELKNPDCWPEGTHISPFFWKIKSHKEEA
ncbi:hypothetical protein QE152_g40079 [Popillia japonica]|uniref:Uncharacterized protein n=1 Tax=Popillia japonica TaxID=7064 RepID=A0AAW1HSB5_POPJA